MLLLLLIGVAVVIAIAVSKNKKPAAGAQGVQVALPDELQGARFWLREQLISCETSISVSGKPDEVFEREDGVLVVSDTKSRDREQIYTADVLQLSVYAYILRKGYKRAVSDYGYVRLHTPQRNIYVRVKLFTDQEVEDAHEAERQLREGKTTGAKCGTKGLCRTCAYKSDCDAMQA